MTEFDKKKFTARLNRTLNFYSPRVAQEVAQMDLSPAKLNAACRQIGLSVSENPRVQIGILAAHVDRVGPEEFLRQWARVKVKGRRTERSGSGASPGGHPHARPSAPTAWTIRYSPAPAPAATHPQAQRPRPIRQPHADQGRAPRSPLPHAAQAQPRATANEPARDRAIERGWPLVERRSGMERRNSKDRRRDVELIFKNSRFGSDRRSGRDRRRKRHS